MIERDKIPTSAGIQKYCFSVIDANGKPRLIIAQTLPEIKRLKHNRKTSSSRDIYCGPIRTSWSLELDFGSAVRVWKRNL